MAPSIGKVAVGGVGAYVTWKYVDGKYGISKDLSLVKNGFPDIKKALRLVKTPGATFVNAWYENLETAGHKNKALFIQAEDGRVTTQQEFEGMSNRIANWAVASGFKPGEVVALVMDNRAEFVATWLGLAKAGLCTALINSNAKGKPLTHAIGVANSVAVIFGTEHADVMEASASEVRAGGARLLASWGAGGTAGIEKPSFCDVGLDEALVSQAATPCSDDRRKTIKLTDPIYFIYTSGTTGLPKACNMSHAKVLSLGNLHSMAALKPGDVIYGSGLPMYHSAANLGLVHALNSGSTYVVRARFSASQQWEDCRKYKATSMQYIGELCRYLLAGADSETAKNHTLRVAIGNGLRPEIWDQFQRTFNIPEIMEFYGATEGAGILLNYCQNYEGQGAVGRNGLLLNKMLPAAIVKFDVASEAPVRDSKTGFCIECGNNEAGELINPIRVMAKTGGGEDMSNFEGYTNKEASEKKMLRDVFKKGDLWYRSGDLLRKDGAFFYFVDRIGDTFRWKGENVSTMEVSEVLSGFPGIVDANVYGVSVPGKDGAAGMVAITMEEGKALDRASFATYCRANLPGYSVPVFVRLLAQSINITGTFKHQKVDYRNQGCDPAKIQDDELWWFNGESGAYEPYNAEVYARITAGRSKL